MKACHPRRQLLLRAGQLLLSLGAADLAHGAGILAVRVWPAADYTRLTIESDTALSARHFMVGDGGPRLVVDIDGMELSPALRELVGKIRADDPYIAAVRIGQYQARVVRLAIDLKQPVAPQQFTLKPVAAYQHRLVFDLYPSTPRDPLLLLLQEKEAAEQRAARAVDDALGDFIGRIQTPGAMATGAGAQAGVSGSAAGAASASTSGAVVGTVVGSAAGSTAGVPSVGTGGGPTATAASAAAAQTAAAASGRPARAPQATATATAPGPGPNAVNAPRTAAGSAARTERLIIVALDPGHGGEDPGATGPTGLREKDVVLAIALQLRDKLQTQRGMRALLTRDGDFYVPLQDRVDKARRVQADLLVSIHADAFMRPQARGASVFALSTRGATSTAARWMADKENAADMVGGVNAAVRDPQLLRAMLDMSTSAQIKDSLKLGAEVLQRMGQVGRLHKRDVEQAGFAVLKAPDVPSILVETAFISNPEEEQLLRDPSYQAQLVDALASGIKRYFAKNPPLARQRQV